MAGCRINQRGAGGDDVDDQTSSAGSAYDGIETYDMLSGHRVAENEKMKIKKETCKVKKKKFTCTQQRLSPKLVSALSCVYEVAAGARFLFGVLLRNFGAEAGHPGRQPKYRPCTIW